MFCAPCDKLFTNSSVFEAHFKGKKHLKSVETFSEEGKGKEKKDQSGALEKLIEKGRLELKKKHSIEIKEAFVTFYGEILKEMNITSLYGIAYGKEELDYATQTVNLAGEQWDNIKKNKNKNILDFITDMEDMENLENKLNTVENNYMC